MSRTHVDTPFLDDWLSHYAQQQPDLDAVICSGRRISYAQLEQYVDGYAALLVEQGLRPGDRLAVLACPGLEFWCSALAAMRIGVIWMGLNPKYRKAEFQYLLGDALPALVLSIDAFEGRHYLRDLGELSVALGSAFRLLPLGMFASDATATSPADAASLRDQFRRARAASDAAAIVYTSGSSGQPKGALLSHYGLTTGAVMQVRQLAVTPQSMVVSFPINHVACLADTCGTTLVSGGKVVFQPRFDPPSVLRATAEEHCNMLGGVPTMLQLLLDDPLFADVDLSSLRLIAWGGAAMPVDYLERLKTVTPRLMTLYGLTETSANIVFGHHPGDGSRFGGSVGRPDERVAYRVVDDQGQPCAPGVSGELQFKADFFFLGYWQREQATREAFDEDGWFRTGDIGVADATGTITLRGRLSEMFKSGGYNVYPREVERVLESQPEVVAAAVVGVPDPLFDEVGFAWIVLAANSSLSAEALNAVCREHLANYKVPKHIRFVTSLPLLPVGKVDKTLLKRRSLEQLNEASSKGTR